MRLYIIRHADPDYPNNTITAAGHLEARALGERMKTQNLTHIYASPLGRAVRTMEYTAKATGLPHKIEDWTAEIHGCDIDLPDGNRWCVWDTHGEIIRANLSHHTHDTWFLKEPFTNPVYHDTFQHLKKNSDAFLARHGYMREEGRYRIVRGNKDRIAVFCHGGFGLWWLAHLLEIPLPLIWSGFWLPPSSVTTVLFDERSKAWATPRAIGVADLSHLYAAGLPVSYSGVKANCD